MAETRITRLTQFLEMVAISGEMTADMVKRMPIGSEYLRKCITEAKKRKLVTVYREDRIKGYRLTAAGKELLLRQNRERFRFFLDGSGDTNLIRTGLQRRSRIHRTAEAYQLMHNAGIEIFRDQKPKLDFDSNEKLMIRTPAYYGSREIKNGDQGAVKIKNSRAVGVLLIPGDYYVVYNTGPGSIRWYSNAEDRLMSHLSVEFECAGLVRSFLDYPRPDRGIMIGESFQTFEQFLHNEKEKMAFHVDGQPYRNMHWVPNNRAGEMMLRMIAYPEHLKRYTSQIEKRFQDVPTAEKYNYFDAFGPNRERILYAFDMDVPKANRFLCYSQDYPPGGIVTCFDFQYHILQRMAEGIPNIRFRLMKTEFGETP